MLIFNEELLTDIEEDSKDKENKNFYNFISTKSQTNQNLKQYIDDIGLYELEDFIYLDMIMIQNIYLLLDNNDKSQMKNYLPEIRKIINNQNFNFIG